MAAIVRLSTDHLVSAFIKMTHFCDGLRRRKMPAPQFVFARLRSIIIVLLCLPLFVHVFQTSLFLIDHFWSDAQQDRALLTQTTIWHQHQDPIPRHIHQIWLASEHRQPMFNHFRSAADDCVRLNQHYNYTLWTDVQIVPWLNQHYPWFVSTYQSYWYDMQRIDAMKYFVLFHYGGVYVDLDIKCKTPDLIQSVLRASQTNGEPDIILHMGTEGISANTDLMAAKQHHPFFQLAIRQLEAANRWFYLYHLTIILSAGPTFLFGIYRQYPWKETFYFVPNDVLWGSLVEGVGGGTWYGNDTLLLLELTNNKLLVSLSLLVLFIVTSCVVRLIRRRYSRSRTK
jgi:inositol phosphorylceramide mannosyltransferase catalytic subunit